MTVTIKDSLTDRERIFLHVTRVFEENDAGVKVYTKEKDGTTSFCWYPMCGIVGALDDKEA